MWSHLQLLSSVTFVWTEMEEIRAKDLIHLDYSWQLVQSIAKKALLKSSNHILRVHTIFATPSAGAFLDLHWKVFILLLTAWMLSKCQANNKEEMPERHLGELWLPKKDTSLVLLTLFLSRAHFGVHTSQASKYEEGKLISTWWIAFVYSYVQVFIHWKILSLLSYFCLITWSTLLKRKRNPLCKRNENKQCCEILLQKWGIKYGG